MRIMIADPDSASRSALALLIDAQTDMEMVGDFPGITDLLVGIKLLQPDLVVLDWDSLSHRYAALQELLQLFEHPPSIIALGVQQEAKQTALDVGADYFAFKGEPPEQLLNLIRQATKSHAPKSLVAKPKAVDRSVETIKQQD